MVGTCIKCGDPYDYSRVGSKSIYLCIENKCLTKYYTLQKKLGRWKNVNKNNPGKHSKFELDVLQSEIKSYTKKGSATMFDRKSNHAHSIMSETKELTGNYYLVRFCSQDLKPMPLSHPDGTKWFTEGEMKSDIILSDLLRLRKLQFKNPRNSTVYPSIERVNRGNTRQTKYRQ